MRKYFGGKDKKGVTKLDDAQLDAISGGQYIPGQFKQEADAFLKSSLGDETYNKIMQGSGSKFPYVAAKIYLGEKDFAKYTWIEQYGSLDGFQG
ncbi:MAG: hypothetical protein IJI10_04085 [Eubacterium sp.]|nr:hypothetical protein [Eubacterium sp.]